MKPLNPKKEKYVLLAKVDQQEVILGKDFAVTNVPSFAGSSRNVVPLHSCLVSGHQDSIIAEFVFIDLFRYEGVHYKFWLR